MTQAVAVAQGGTNNVTFRNRIINGGMVIDQRNAGASFAPSADGYTLDRWFISGYGTGFNSATVQRLSSGVVSGFSNYLRMQCNSTTGTNLFLSQSVETNNCYDLAGQSVTISFWYRVNTNFTNQCTVLLGTSTSADTKIVNSGGTTTTIGTLTNTSTWTRFTVTVSVPSNALTVGVLISNGYNNVVNGANIDITGVQLEAGTTATPFEQRLYGTELALCQRYTYVINGVNYPISCGLSYGTTTSNCVIPFPVTMRISPSATYAGTTDFQTTNGSGSGIASTNVNNYVASPNSFEFTIVVASGLTVGQAAIMRTGPAGTAKITLSAEL